MKTYARWLCALCAALCLASVLSAPVPARADALIYFFDIPFGLSREDCLALAGVRDIALKEEREDGAPLALRSGRRLSFGGLDFGQALLRFQGDRFYFASMATDQQTLPAQFDPETLCYIVQEESRGELVDVMDDYLALVANLTALYGQPGELLLRVGVQDILYTYRLDEADALQTALLDAIVRYEDVYASVAYGNMTAVWNLTHRGYGTNLSDVDIRVTFANYIGTVQAAATYALYPLLAGDAAEAQPPAVFVYAIDRTNSVTLSLGPDMPALWLALDGMPPEEQTLWTEAAIRYVLPFFGIDRCDIRLGAGEEGRTLAYDVQTFETDAAFGDLLPNHTVSAQDALAEVADDMLRGLLGNRMQ